MTIRNTAFLVILSYAVASSNAVAQPTRQTPEKQNIIAIDEGCGELNAASKNGKAGMDLAFIEAILQQKPRKIGIVFTENEVGLIIQLWLHTHLEKLVPQPEFFEESHYNDQQIVKSQLENILRNHPDLVVVNTSSDATGDTIILLRELGYTRPIYAWELDKASEILSKAKLDTGKIYYRRDGCSR